LCYVKQVNAILKQKIKSTEFTVATCRDCSVVSA
jgi:hypothetical protein